MDKKPSVLVMVSVEAEKEALQAAVEAEDAWEVQVGGVGAAQMSVRTSLLLAEHDYDLVINAGIAGAFPDKAWLGDIVAASEIVAADMGAETEEGFAPLEKLGLGPTRFPTEKKYTPELIRRLAEQGISAVEAPVLSVSTVTGTQAMVNQRAFLYEDAAAEAMEGYGVAAAASYFGIPVMEIRAISNEVGPRDRDAWNIPGALNSLRSAVLILQEVTSS
ncbi:futalosine hydrolase [Marinococcus luteus]|uniref:futalosine hydrolase n=1 Tax=Marinococcus luteus TaxID=1122204 RepID=UPI002ACCC8D6|nr:futalosine hydrolase [Marinococcus luteus]MDZ5783956.1 futalosine hydrolase [Marinococcus luteus]